MNRVEGYTFMFTRQIKDRINQEGCSVEEYQQLLRNIRDFCNRELRENKKHEN